MSKAPTYNYPEWKQQPHRGIRGGNSNFLMSALFIEKNVPRRADLALYTANEEAYEYKGQWFPSAYQIVIHSTDEYEAMRKLVGNMEQWDRLKDLEWFATWLEFALREQKALQELAIKKVMLELAADGDKQAAKIVLELAKKRAPVGRPVKEKAHPKAANEGSDDSDRVVQFSRGT